MATSTHDIYVMGVDFGTSSVRSLVLDAHTGEEVATASHEYPRYEQGRFCDPTSETYRQHPADYIEALKGCVASAVSSIPEQRRKAIRALTIDTTGSTPAPVDRSGTPLALKEEFAEEPDAMFHLWKDHSSQAEANEITEVASTALDRNYLEFNGGIFSPEWLWAKVLRVTRKNPAVAEKTSSWLEHSDWLPALLTGVKDLSAVKRNRCGASLKALWQPAFGGYPPADLFQAIDQRLLPILQSLGNESFTADVPAGRLENQWAAVLGLQPTVLVGVGVFDAHTAAIGAGVGEETIVRNMGTSASDMAVTPRGEGSRRAYYGIEGQADGSIVPGMIGLEAGQSAFGDILNWYARQFSPDKSVGELVDAALRTVPTADHPIAVDWHAGRRSPGVNARLRSITEGVTLGHTREDLFMAHVLGILLGARRIYQTLKEQGLAFTRIRAVGGVAKRAPQLVEMLSNALQLPIEVTAAQEASARGAATLASVVAGVYPRTEAAIENLQSPVDRVYEPRKDQAPLYDALYGRYLRLCDYEEELSDKRERRPE